MLDNPDFNNRLPMCAYSFCFFIQWIYHPQAKTLFCCCSVLLDMDRSWCSILLLFSSNLLSNSLAFININFLPDPTDRCPVNSFRFFQSHEIFTHHLFYRNLNKIKIFLKLYMAINTMFLSICITLIIIKTKIHDI